MEGVNLLARKLCTVNYNLIPIKAHYFFLYGAIGGVSPFLTVIGKDLGLSATAVGISYTILPICVFLFKPLFGFLSDYFQNVKGIIIFLMTTTVLVYCCIPFINPVEENDCTYCIKTQLQCNGSFRTLPLDFNDTCVMNVMSRDTVICNITQEDMSETGGKHIKKVDNIKTRFKCNDSYYEGLDDKDPLSSSSNCSITFKDEKLDSKNLCNENYKLITPSLSCANELETCLVLKTKAEFYITYQFWMFTLLMVTGLSFQFSSMSLTDVACYELLGKKRENFGRQRLWGTASNGFITLLAGYLNDLLSKSSGKTEYLSGIYIMIALYGLNLVIMFKMHLPKVNLSKQIMSDVVGLFRKKDFIIYASAVFMVGVFTSLNANYLFWYLKDLGANQTLLGAAIAVQCLVAEVPFFFFAGWVIKSLGYFNCLTSTFASFALRFGLYSILGNPWWVLPIEVLHGVTYAIFCASNTSFAAVNAAPGTEGTVIGLLGGLCDGLGSAVGSLLGGLGFSNIGGSNTFLVACCFSVLWIPVTVISHFIFKEPKVRLSRDRGHLDSFRGSVIRD